MRQIENRVAGIGGFIPKAVAEADTARKRLQDIEEAKGRPFKYAIELTQARARLTEIDTQISERERQAASEPAEARSVTTEPAAAEVSATPTFPRATSTTHPRPQEAARASAERTRTRPCCVSQE